MRLVEPIKVLSSGVNFDDEIRIIDLHTQPFPTFSWKSAFGASSATEGMINCEAGGGLWGGDLGCLHGRS